MRQHLWFALPVGLLLSTVPTQARVTPDEALRALTEGNRRFVRGELLRQPLGEGVRRTLAGGQHPFAIVLASADSRVVPEHIFNVGLGALYVVRVAGNVADPAALASIEYAAEHLGATLCVVLGHHGSEFASLPNAGEESAGYIRIAGRLRPAWERATREGLDGDRLLARAAEENTYETMAECLRRSAVLRELVRLEQFRLLPAMYDLDRGEVSFLPPRPLHDVVSTRHDEAALRTKTSGLPPHVALALLQAGHRRFLSGTNGQPDLSAARRQALVTAQRPFALVLTDADARLAPEHLFDAGLGDLAVVRVLGCALDDEVLGSIEHAVREHGIGLVLVLAPERCGITELLLEHQQPHLTPSLRTVADWLEPALVQAQHAGAQGPDLHRAVVRGNVQRTAQELARRSPLLRRLVERGQLGVLGGVYRLTDGEIEWVRDALAHADAGHDSAAMAGHAAGDRHADHGDTAPAHGQRPSSHGHQPDAHAAPAAETKPHTPATPPESHHGHARGHEAPGHRQGDHAHAPPGAHVAAPDPHAHDAHGAFTPPTTPRKLKSIPPASPSKAAAPANPWAMLLVNLAVFLAGAALTIMFLRIGQRRAARAAAAG